MNNNGRLYVNKLKEIPEIKGTPLNEYPRPNFVRDSYFNLNGKWDFAIRQNEDLPIEFDDEILVPFVPECPLSGINYLVKPEDYLFYRRTFDFIKKNKNNRVIINFDGVDMFTKVYINGTFVGEHSGGYTKFSFDITDCIKEKDNEIIVIVNDPSDTSYHLRGKQTLNVTGYFYTTSSGIYKTVWLEEVPIHHIQKVRFTPLYDEEAVGIYVDTNFDGEVELTLDGKTFEIEANSYKIIKLENPKSWSHKNPYLYDVTIKSQEDEIKSYFGFRKIEIKDNEQGLPTLYLNDKKVILNGLLDQGYYFLGNLTPASNSDYENEIKELKRLGFNTLRKHIKVESDLFYYYCDKYGMLVVQDFVNGGTPYKFLEVVLPRVFTPFINKESWMKEGMFGREDEEGQIEFIKESKEIVNSLYNYPSIIIYTIFNEAWGEFKPSECYKIFKNIDPTRLYDTASGWVDSKNSDFYSVHSYTIPTRKRFDKKYGRPYFLSETGGIAYKVPGHSYFDGLFGHKIAKTKENYNKKYFTLYNKLLKQVQKGTLIGIINTEVADCEIEYNGIFTYDRKVLKVYEDKLIKLNKKISDCED